MKENKGKKEVFHKDKKKHISPQERDVQEYQVKSPNTLLSFLFELFPGKSKTGVKSLLSTRRVCVNGAPVTQFDFALERKDVVMIYKNPVKKVARSNLPILYEDEDLIVINKPTKLLSVPSDNERGSTAFRMVNDYLQQKDKHSRIFVVHRIDEDTSGVLLFAKNSEMAHLLTDKDNWNHLVTKRGYYAIVEGVMKEKKGTIKSYLKKNSLNLMYSSKDKDGQFAVTHYAVIKENQDYSLLDVSIDSGRKNQIRVHLGERGHYIIGDDKYGKPKDPLGRLGLHAYCLELMNPKTKKKMTFQAPIPQEFLALFEKKVSQEKKEEKKVVHKERRKAKN